MFLLVFSLSLLCTTLLVVFFGVRWFDTQKVDAVCKVLQAEESHYYFSEQLIDGLPLAVQRYFRHSIEMGTLLASSASLALQGAIRLEPGRKPMRIMAKQVISWRGYVWQGTLQRVLAWFTGNDLYVAGNCRVMWWLWGFIPLRMKHGKDQARSQAARAALERIWLPSTLLPLQGVQWEGVDEKNAKAFLNLDGYPITLHMKFTDLGALDTVRVKRWMQWDKRSVFAEMDYVLCNVQVEETIAGYTIPMRFQAGWQLKPGLFVACYEPMVNSITYK